MYLLDANILISAANTFYKFSRVPEYWDWLKHHGEQGNVKLPQEIYDEITVGRDQLSDWMKEKACKEALCIKQTSNPRTVQHVLDNGYGTNLNEVELEYIGKDPFLVACAFSRPDRCVVTAEVLSQAKKRHMRKVPDVCDSLGVRWISGHAFLDVLDFRTNWKP